MDLSLAGKDCQHAVTDESLCTVAGCALGTNVCHWMFKTKINIVQGQEDGPLNAYFEKIDQTLLWHVVANSNHVFLPEDGERIK